MCPRCAGTLRETWFEDEKSCVQCGYSHFMHIEPIKDITRTYDNTRKYRPRGKTKQERELSRERRALINAVACPRCDSPIGKGCRTVSGYFSISHKERTQLLEAVT